MKIGILNFLFLIWSLSAYAGDNVISLNTVASDKSLANVVSLMPTFKNLGADFSLDLSLDAGRYSSQVNYNTAVDDFVIERNTVTAGADLTWNRMLTMGVAGSNENINGGEAKAKGVSSKLRLRLQDVAIKATLTDRYIRQNNAFVVLGADIKNQLTVRDTREGYTLSYYGFENLSFSLNYGKYHYDTDVATMNTLLTTKAVLNKNGAAFLSQIYSLIDHEENIDMVYNATDSWDIELTLGTSTDFLDPYTKSNDYRLGMAYYFKAFSLGGGVTALKSDDDSDPTYSGDLTLSYEF